MQKKPSYILADANARLTRATEDVRCITNVPYVELVGCLMYIVTCTRPDITDVVCSVAKYCEYHTSEHWSEAKRIHKYLLTTQDLALVYDENLASELI